MKDQISVSNANATWFADQNLSNMSPMFWGESIEFRDYFRDRKSWHGQHTISRKRKITRKLSHFLYKKSKRPEAHEFAVDHQTYIWRLWQVRKHFKRYGYSKVPKPFSFFRFRYFYDHDRFHRSLEGYKKIKTKKLLKAERTWWASHEFKRPGKEIRAWITRLKTRQDHRLLTFDPMIIKKFAYSRKRFTWDTIPLYPKQLKKIMLSKSHGNRNRFFWWLTDNSNSVKPANERPTIEPRVIRSYDPPKKKP